MAGEDGGHRGDVARVIVEVAPFHLDRPFDYLLADDMAVVAGQRVQVPFAGRLVRGLVVDVVDEPSVPRSRCRPVRRVLGEHRWVRDDELEVLRWAAGRFGAPVADVVRHALPARTVDVERRAADAGWYPPGTGTPPQPAPAPPAHALAAAWAPYGEEGAGLVRAAAGGAGSYLWRPLPDEDVAARLAELVQAALAGGRDALVVVPDPASPVADAVVAAAGDLAVDVRGGPSPRVWYRRWLEARCGQARVVVGERGAALFPLERLGLAVVLDEANPALKERRSPRHHAREVVLERARRAGGVGMLVGTVPSATAWALLRERRLRAVVPERRAERERRPHVRVSTQPVGARTRLSSPAVRALREAVADGAYGVVLAARRGEGRALVCGACGQRLACPVCAASLATDARGGVHCEGCGFRRRRVPACEACGERKPVPLAAGAERLGRELSHTVSAPVSVLEGYAQQPPTPPAVVVATRGSVLDAPWGPVGAVVLPDLDGSLRRPTLDAAEDALRLSMAVARWTVAPGAPSRARVVVETREPEHHAVRALEAWDPGGFWRREATLRRPLRFPPAAAAIRVELADATMAERVRAVLPPGDEALGPVPAGERDALLLKTDDRAATLAALADLRAEASRAGVDVRVDVDPVDAI